MAEHQISEFALPGLLGDIARWTTPEIAIIVGRELGGQEIYWPQDVPRGHRLAKLVGLQAARVIARHWAGEREPRRRSVPSARSYLRWYDARALAQSGKTHRDIAQALSIGMRHVGRLLQGFDPQQASVMSLPAGCQAVCPTTGQPCKARRGKVKRGDDRQFALVLDPATYEMPIEQPAV